MALKKSDLYGSLWRSCDELRGGMDASQYKDYILTLLFVKYVSDKARSDVESVISIPTGGSFDDILALKGKPDIGEKINKVIGFLADANGLEKVIDLADFNDDEKLGKGKEMTDRLSKLVGIFADLDFSSAQASGDDLLGDAYEYLMQHFATESGKSKGQFYTPAEVSQVLAKIVGVPPNSPNSTSVYDPTCGSGSLLLKVAMEAGKELSLYGQEKDNATWALARMNMILHSHEGAEIEKGDTITSPEFKTENGLGLKTFDFAVANPPFSLKSWNNGLTQEFGRFDYGHPPEKNGDYAFLQHILKSLKSHGKAAVILPHGVLFRGHAEGHIRQRLLQEGVIRGIIGLPANLFYGTGIPACIIVLDKENAHARRGVFMVDASKGFVKDGNKNRLRSQDIHRIVDVFTKQIEAPGYSRMVPLHEISDPNNDYNLNLPRYIDSAEPEDVQDLSAHLHGGIPDRDIDALAKFWQALPSLRATLFTENRPGYVDLAVPVAQVQQAVLDSAEFTAFAAQAQELLAKWFAEHRPALAAVGAKTHPKQLIARLGDDLLARFSDLPLLDAYDVYEQLMTYWFEAMSDDVSLLIDQGWQRAARPREAVLDPVRKLSETPDIVLGSGRAARKFKLDLIPRELILARFFSAEQAAVLALAAAFEQAGRVAEEYLEEHSAEDGPLADALEDGKLTAAQVKKILKSGVALADQERAALKKLGGLYALEVLAKKKAKDAEVELDQAVIAKYGQLTVVEIQELVLDDKWLASISGRVAAEVNSLTLDLVARLQQLGERYAETVADLEAQLAELEAKVSSHLTAMGVL